MLSSCTDPSRCPQEVYRLQLRCFLGLVHEQQHLPALKQLLKLYTSISLTKLGSLLELDEAALRSQLMLLKVLALLCLFSSGWVRNAVHVVGMV